MENDNDISTTIYSVILFSIVCIVVYFLVRYLIPMQVQQPVTCMVELVKHNETSQLQGRIK